MKCKKGKHLLSYARLKRTITAYFSSVCYNTRVRPSKRVSACIIACIAGSCVFCVMCDGVVRACECVCVCLSVCKLVYPEREREGKSRACQPTHLSLRHAPDSTILVTGCWVAALTWENEAARHQKAPKALQQRRRETSAGGSCFVGRGTGAAQGEGSALR